MGPARKEGVSVKGRLRLEESLSLLAVKMIQVTETIGKIIRQKKENKLSRIPLPSEGNQW